MVGTGDVSPEHDASSADRTSIAKQRPSRTALHIESSRTPRLAGGASRGQVRHVSHLRTRRSHLVPTGLPVVIGLVGTGWNRFRVNAGALLNGLMGHAYVRWGHVPSCSEGSLSPPLFRLSPTPHRLYVFHPHFAAPWMWGKAAQVAGEERVRPASPSCLRPTRPRPNSCAIDPLRRPDTAALPGEGTDRTRQVRHPRRSSSAVSFGEPAGRLPSASQPSAAHGGWAVSRLSFSFKRGLPCL